MFVKLQFYERVEISGASVEKGRENGHLGIFKSALLTCFLHVIFCFEQKRKRLILQFLGLLSLTLLALFSQLAVVVRILLCNLVSRKR